MYAYMLIPLCYLYSWEDLCQAKNVTAYIDDLSRYAWCCLISSEIIKNMVRKKHQFIKSLKLIYINNLLIVSEIFNFDQIFSFFIFLRKLFLQTKIFLWYARFINLIKLQCLQKIEFFYLQIIWMTNRHSICKETPHFQNGIKFIREITCQFP